MPTGYTYKIEKGCTFEEYVWSCARAMGACVMMRDEPGDAPIPESFEPSKWYFEELEKAKNEVDHIKNVSDADIVEQQVLVNARIRTDNERRRVEAGELERRYKAIEDKVKAWNPPTADHEGLKEFMLQQIDVSTRHNDPWIEKENPIVTPEEWRKQAMELALKNLARKQDEWNKEQERTNGRNQWLKQLRESVPQPNK